MSLNKDYAEKMMSNFASLGDVTLIAGLDHEKFSVPRRIFAQSSQYFEALFGPNFREGTEKEVVLTNIDGPALKAVILFIYIGHVELNGDNIESILGAASSLEVIALEQECGQYLFKNLSVRNCVKTLMLADKYSFSQLKTNALKLVCTQFENIPRGDILQIDGNIFNELLKCELFAVPETNIFKCLLKWVRRNETDRAKCMPELLKLIRLEHMSGEFIYSTVEPIFKQYGLTELIRKEYQNRFRATQPARRCRCTGRFALCEISIISADSSKPTR